MCVCLYIWLTIRAGEGLCQVQVIVMSRHPVVKLCSSILEVGQQAWFNLSENVLFCVAFTDQHGARFNQKMTSNKWGVNTRSDTIQVEVRCCWKPTGMGGCGLIRLQYPLDWPSTGQAGVRSGQGSVETQEVSQWGGDSLLSSNPVTHASNLAA